MTTKHGQNVGDDSKDGDNGNNNDSRDDDSKRKINYNVTRRLKSEYPLSDLLKCCFMFITIVTFENSKSFKHNNQLAELT